MDPKHLQHQSPVGSTTLHEERLKSRHHFVPAEHKLLNELSKLKFVLHNGLAINWTRSTQNVDQSSASLYQGSAPDNLKWVCPGLLRLDSTIFALMLEYSCHPSPNWDLLFLQSVVWCIRSKRRPYNSGIPTTSCTQRIPRIACFCTVRLDVDSTNRREHLKKISYKKKSV